MKTPFRQHIQDTFSRLQGRNLIVAVVVWLMLLAVGLACVLGAFEFPGLGETASLSPTTSPEETASATVAPTEADLAEPAVGGGNDEAQATPTASSGSASEDIETQPTSTSTPLPHDQETLAPLPWGDFGYGIAAHGIGMPYYTMGQVKDHLGLTWVKQQVRWDHFSGAPGEMDWSGYDAMVDAADEAGLKVMMSVVGSPEWSRSYFDGNPEAAPPDDFGLFAAFLREMVDRYQGRIHAIEVWNEQNLDREWDTSGGVNAASYVELLRLSYQAIKSRDPEIVVISGALSPTGVVMTDPADSNRYIVVDDFVYLQQMIDAGFLNYADCVGVHHNGNNMPPDVAWDDGYNDPTATFRGPFDSPHISWSFKSTLWGYHEMIKAAQRSTPLCVTEFGWATSEGFDGTPPGFEFADDNTLEEQAKWDVQAFQLMREWGFVHLAFLWNLDYSYKGGLGATDPNAPYSVLDLSGAGRPAFDAVATMEKLP